LHAEGQGIDPPHLQFFIKILFLTLLIETLSNIFFPNINFEHFVCPSYGGVAAKVLKKEVRKFD
jgi:hypothetical protein